MRYQTLADWLAWQQLLHPAEIALGLTRAREVLRNLDWTHPHFPILSVAGTNGKGSIVAYLEAIFVQAGYRVGTYTSPHLVRYNERIRLNGHAVSDNTLMDAFAEIDAARGATLLTYFEFATMAAMSICRSKSVDIAIFEVGLGGRLDAVNLFDADVMILGTIDIDHVDYLGDNRETIGREKAGIMRVGRPVVLGDRAPPASVLEVAETLRAPVYQVGEDFGAWVHQHEWTWWGPSEERSALPLLPMSGVFQYDNASTALMAAKLTPLPIHPCAYYQSLKRTTVMGRFQILAPVDGRPVIIFDVGHNQQATREIARNLSTQPHHGRTLAVVGMLSDKQHQQSLKPLVESIDAWFLADLLGPRANRAAVLAAALKACGTTAECYCHTNVLEAYHHALEQAGGKDRILVFGSFVIVGTVMEYLGIIDSGEGM